MRKDTQKDTKEKRCKKRHERKKMQRKDTKEKRSKRKNTQMKKGG